MKLDNSKIAKQKLMSSTKMPKKLKYAVKTVQVNLHEKAGECTWGPQVFWSHM